MSNAPNSSRYSHYLRELTDKQAAVLDEGEATAGRSLKKRKRGIAVPSRRQGGGASASNEATSAPTAAAAPAAPQHAGSPGPSSGLSQNTNGSEQTGPKARAEFVSKTLNSAVAAQGAEPADTQLDLSDTEMADRSGSDDDNFEDETPKETTYLKRLKHLYARQADTTTQQALLAALETLSQEPKTNRGKRRPKQEESWDQDEDYLCTDSPRHREKQRVALSGYIRLILGQRLKLKDAKSPLPHRPPPEIAAPTTAGFYIKWNESEKSEFNAIAARIVALQVVADYPSLCDLDEIHDMVTLHIKYLRARYRRQTNPVYIAKESQRLRSASAGTRKRTLYNHRLAIINAIPVLARHGRLIETLGLEGTSSDEEDSTRPGVYIIKRRKELSPQLNHMKGQLDLAYSIHFKGPGSKGNQVRKRVEKGLVSNRRFQVEGLPLSCMNPSWLSTLSTLRKDMYHFCDVQYDFTFPEELLQSPEDL
ncbi:hypothetical protein FRC08_008778 [Ceratobasidium sp. 394]|nr:hypothetical protein FRC08_008778 [Ceratobasidium sp. 394]